MEVAIYFLALCLVIQRRMDLACCRPEPLEEYEWILFSDFSIALMSYRSVHLGSNSYDGRIFKC